MHRILVINPVSTSAWDRITYEYLKSIAFPRTEVVVRSLKEGPKSIESEYDRDLAARYVVEEVVRAEKEGFDAVVINCFDDPGLHAARERASILVLGIGETSITTALLLGHKIAIISTGRNSRALYHRKALELGVIDRVAYTGGIEVGVLEMREDVDRLKKLVISEARKAIDVYGAEVIVLGCGGFIGLAKDLEKALGVPVIDPTPTTFKIAEALVSIGMKHSKVYLYNPPKHKVKEWETSRPT